MSDNGKNRPQRPPDSAEFFSNSSLMSLPFGPITVRSPTPESPVPQLDVRIATDRDELLAAYGLVYRAYLARRYVRPHRGRILYHRIYCLPTSRTIIARLDDRVVGTLTVVEGSIHRLPLEVTFATEIATLRRAGRSLAEVTSLAIDRRACPADRDVFVELTRFMVQYAYWRGVDDLLLAVHPRHAAFYQRRFAVERLGGSRAHAPVGGKPAVACRLDLAQVRQVVDPALVARYLTPPIAEDAFDCRPMRHEDHQYLCHQMGWKVGRDEQEHAGDHRRAA